MMAPFRFRQFAVDDHGCGMKICSDSVLLGAWFLPQYAHSRRIADIGAGSGLLALMAAQCCPAAQIEAVETDATAARACNANIISSPWADRVRCAHADFGAWQHTAGQFDLVISNPPYFATGEHAADASRATARHADAGLSYDTLLASGILAQGAHMGIVAPADAEEHIMYSATMSGLRLCRLCRVSTAAAKAPTRILADFVRPSAAPSAIVPVIEHLPMRQLGGEYTAQYRTLTHDFYLKL